MIPDRIALLQHCKQIQLAHKLDYAKELQQLHEASAADTKSSAGDKYETGREMIAQNRTMIANHLEKTERCIETIDRMMSVKLANQVVFGSLVKTTMGWYLVGVSIGEIQFNEILVRTLTLVSPLGISLRNKGLGDVIPWRGSTFKILQICT